MQQYLEAGKVVTTHGVRGEIKLEMVQARSKVVPFPTETAALAA